MRVQEIMTKDVVSLKPEDNALDALKLLFKMGISGLPVLDSGRKLVGAFTEKNVLSHILPSYIQKVGKFIYEENPKSTRKKFCELAGIKVEQLMSREEVTTKVETTLCEVARVMLTQKVRRLPVVDVQGKVVGIIARCDILKAMAKEAEMGICG
jgi:CBS-domain-containing membrane protein